METKPESLEVDANCFTVEAKKHEMELGYVSETIRIKCWSLEVCRTSDRVMAVTIVLSDNVWTIVSAYAPQVGCDEDTQKCILERAGSGDNEGAAQRKTRTSG